MIRSISAISLAAVLIAAPSAFAQKPDTSAGGSRPQTELKKDGTSMEMKKDDAARPGQNQSSGSSSEAKPSASRESEGEREVAGQIVLQEDDTFLASDLMNTNVYTSTAKDAEAVGDINDIIFAKAGDVEGVVIGVGGFLGIGEKNVAIKMDRIKMNEGDDGIKLVLETTKEELEKAPKFKSKRTQKAEAQAEQAKRDAERRMKNPGALPAKPAPSGQQKKAN